MSAPLVPEPAEQTGGAALLDEVHAALTGYVVLPSAAAADAVTLWIAATHTVAAFEHATRLVVKSPEKRCGKTRLLEVIAETCHRPLMTVNATVAAVFRSIGDDPPTLLLDEADAVFGTKVKAEQNEDLRALLNAGFDRNRPALRTVGQNHTPIEFATFAMAALAGIGAMPDTIEDRAVIVTMRRRAPGESVQSYRTRRDRPRLNALRDRLAEWAQTIADDLADAEPATDLEDRAADAWEPLLAIADAAGGCWPVRARTAAQAIVNASAEQDTQANLNTKLLADIRDVFTTSAVEFLASRDLVELLRLAEESPWSEFNLNTNGLARRLSGYGIKPKPDTAGKVRGYHLSAFSDAFARYLPVRVSNPSETVRAPETQGFSSDGWPASDTLNRQTLAQPSDGFSEKQRDTTVSDGSDTPPGDAEADPDARTPTDATPAWRSGNPRCTVCGKPNLFAPVSIARRVCAGCVKANGAGQPVASVASVASVECRQSQDDARPDFYAAFDQGADEVACQMCGDDIAADTAGQLCARCEAVVAS